MVLSPQSTSAYVYSRLAEYFECFQSFRDAAAAGADAEAIHQMRVYARRMRSVAEAFAPMVDRRLAEIDPELRWIAASLGRVRDVDVQLERAVNETVARLLQETRKVRLSQLRRDLHSKRYRELADRLAEILRKREAEPPDMDLAFSGPEVLGFVVGKLRKAGDGIQPSDEIDRFHKLRKRAKKVRYVVDCLEPLYGRAATRFVDKLKSFQDDLGKHQDFVIAEQLFCELRDGAMGKEAQVLSKAAKQSARRAERLRLALPAAYRKLRGKALQELLDQAARLRKKAWKKHVQTSLAPASRLSNPIAPA